MYCRGQQFWAYYTVIGSNLLPRADDLDYHTIYLTRDAQKAVAANNQGGPGKHVEIGHGGYAILITAAEADCDSWQISGLTTIDGAIIPKSGQLPTAVSAEALAAAIRAANVTIVSPLSRLGALALAMGDDYLAGDGRALAFLDSGTTWPDFSGGSASLVIRRRGFNTRLLTVAGTVLGPRHFRFELTAAQTGLLVRAPLLYAVVGTLANGHVVTVQTGPVTIDN